MVCMASRNMSLLKMRDTRSCVALSKVQGSTRCLQTLSPSTPSTCRPPTSPHHLQARRRLWGHSTGAARLGGESLDHGQQSDRQALPLFSTTNATRMPMVLSWDVLPLHLNPLAPNLCPRVISALTQTPPKTHPILLTRLDVLVPSGSGVGCEDHPTTVTPWLPSTLTLRATSVSCLAPGCTSMSVYFPGWATKFSLAAQLFLVFSRNFFSKSFLAASREAEGMSLDWPTSPWQRTAVVRTPAASLLHQPHAGGSNLGAGGCNGWQASEQE